MELLLVKNSANALSDFQFPKNITVIFANFDFQSTTVDSYFPERFSTENRRNTKLVLLIPPFTQGTPVH